MSSAENHPATQHQREDAITQEVLARYDTTADPRMRELMKSLITHLHGFARDVRLSPAEWIAACNFLAMSGEFCTGGRQEFIGVSALVGLETLVLEMAEPKPPGATLPTVLGPFYIPNSPVVANGGDLANGATGEPLFVSGRVLNTGGEPLPNAVVEVWHSDGRGLYDVQEDIAKNGMWARGQLKSAADGRYSFWTVTPVPYPAPSDGGMGAVFKHTSNHAWRPAHMHFSIRAEGYDPLTTEVFVRGSKYLENDTAFAVRPGLVADFAPHDSGKAPDGRQMDHPFRTLDFNFVLTRNGR